MGERERETGRQTDRHTDTQTGRQRQRLRQRDSSTGSTNKHMTDEEKAMHGKFVG